MSDDDSALRGRDADLAPVLVAHNHRAVGFYHGEQMAMIQEPPEPGEAEEPEIEDIDEADEGDEEEG